MAELGVKVIWAWCPVCWVRTEQRIVLQEQTCTHCQTSTKLSGQNRQSAVSAEKERANSPNPPYAPGAIPAS